MRLKRQRESTRKVADRRALGPPSSDRESRTRFSMAESDPLVAELIIASPISTTSQNCYHMAGTDSDWSPPESHSGWERTGFRSRSSPHNMVAIAPAPAQPASSPVHASVLATPGSAPPATTQQVVYRERFLSKGEGHRSPQTPESWQGTLRREFTKMMDSHASGMQALIDQRLEEKLSSLQS